MKNSYKNLVNLPFELSVISYKNMEELNSIILNILKIARCALKNTLLLSFNRSSNVIANQFIMSKSKLSKGKLDKEKLSKEDLEKITNATLYIKNLSLLIEDLLDFDIGKIYNKILGLKEEKDISFVILDCFNVAEFEKVQEGLKKISKELKISIIILKGYE